jgi:hypothetical protein
MKKTLLASTTAVALLAASSFSLAQSGNVPGGTGGAPSAAPAGGGSMGGDRQGGAGERGAAPAQRSGSEQRQPRNSAQQGSSQNAPAERRTGQPNGVRGDREQAQTPRQGQRDGRTGQREGQKEQNGERQKKRAGANERGKDTNTGSAPANIQVTTEQRTRIRDHRSSLNVGRVTNVNFNISVGTVVPRTVRVYDLPVEIVTIVPAYRGYKYILVEEEIVIIDPRTLRIVAVIDV